MKRATVVVLLGLVLCSTPSAIPCTKGCHHFYEVKVGSLNYRYVPDQGIIGWMSQTPVGQTRTKSDKTEWHLMEYCQQLVCDHGMYGSDPKEAVLHDPDDEANGFGLKTTNMSAMNPPHRQNSFAVKRAWSQPLE